MLGHYPDWGGTIDFAAMYLGIYSHVRDVAGKDG